MEFVPALSRWMHIMAGIMWLGLLYYFNFVQAQALRDAQSDGTAAGIARHVAPRALFWFRWSALVTWLAGAALLGRDFLSAFSLQATHLPIGIGAWLGTIMLINVWAIIWPCQKRALGLVEASEEQRARSRRTAFLVSRANLALSFPMLFFMAAAGHTSVFFR